MKVKYIILTFFVITFCSCDDILQESPKDFISPSEFFKTEAEVEAAIYGVYDFLNDRYIAEYEWIMMGDLGTDVSMTRNIARMIYQYSAMDITPAEYLTAWQMNYRGIGAANMVINRVESSDVLPEEFKKRIVGEAKFLRAFFYYNLNLRWGNVPLWLDELDLGNVEKLGTIPAEQVRAQVIKDLSEAAVSLPQTVSQAGRVTSWAAKGLLARVYLFDKQWQKAKEQATDVINNSNHVLLPNYYDVFFWTNKNNKELIHIVPKAADIKMSMLHSFSVPRVMDEGPKFNFPAGVSAIRPDGKLSKDKTSRNPGSLFQGWGMYQTLKENFDSFEAGDTRKELWWSELKFTNGTSLKFIGGSSVDLPGRSGYYNLKWVAWDEAPDNGGRDTHLQRLAELYLILAEAENELNGPTNVAYQAINTVRRRAFGGTGHDLSGLSKDEFRRAVINENRWELGGEGLRRWYLWHWGYDEYRKAAEFVKVSNPKLFENLQPHHVFFRIPDTEIAKNPNLLQNPGYK